MQFFSCDSRKVVICSSSHSPCITLGNIGHLKSLHPDMLIQVQEIKNGQPTGSTKSVELKSIRRLW